MSQLTLQLPETLHQQLVQLAESEGVSLDQYIVYALTRQVAIAYTVQKIPVGAIEPQKQAFEMLLQKLGKASSSQLSSTLAQREITQPEEELSAEVVARLQQRINDASGSD